ncbi:MAG: hypothetical protein ACSHXA_07405 [Polaribacter sp.]|uniref:hypothetical protein n=1 Tax=Polaribacter sp. TaxID=1920175 RepID=UPI003EFAE0C3
MNSLQKYREDIEPYESKQHPKEQMYYLQRRLRMKDIPYSSRKQIVFATPEETEDKHVQKLLKIHNYTVQTIIK